jgi:hypothetical protein
MPAFQITALSPLKAALELEMRLEPSHHTLDPAGRVFFLFHHQPSHVAAQQNHQGQLSPSTIVTIQLHRFLSTPLLKAGLWIV